MHQNFEVIPDVSGLHMKVRGASLEELFSNAVRAVAFYVKPKALLLKKSELKEWYRIKVEAVDIVSLLVEFLEKVIEHIDMHQAVFPVVSFEKFGENFLEGKIFGAKSEEFENEIQGVSFDEVEIRKDPHSGLYETTLVFEI